MTRNHSAFLTGFVGCVVGAMIPLALGASQAPEPQNPHFLLSTNDVYFYVVDNRKEEFHVYTGARGGTVELTRTFDLSQVGGKKLEPKYDRFAEMFKKTEEQKNKTKLPPTTSE
jgi:hypothetical protein